MTIFKPNLKAKGLGSELQSKGQAVYLPRYSQPFGPFFIPYNSQFVNNLIWIKEKL